MSQFILYAHRNTASDNMVRCERKVYQRGLVVNGATRNAQQTIYRLYFGAFGTQFFNQPRG